MDERLGCAEIRELLPELAAGIATGNERAQALRHLSSCADCRQELAALATVVDELVMLAAPVEPPGGFESAVLARIGQENTATRDSAATQENTATQDGTAKSLPVRRRGWWRGRALRLAVAVVLATGVGITVGAAATMRATAEDRSLAASYRQTLADADGRYLAVRRLNVPDPATIGRVFAYQGNPSWVFVVLRSGAPDGSYRVLLLTKDGREQQLGEFGVAGGRGSWGIAIDVGVEDIAEVRLLNGSLPALTAVFR